MDKDQFISFPVSTLFRILWPVVLFVPVAAIQLSRGRAPYIADGVHQPVRQMHASASFATPHLWLKRQERRDPKEDNNHATVEFRENGTRADDCTVPHPDGTPCQLTYAMDFLRDAKTKLSTNEILNVLVYVHGNENWAGEDSDNYPHFRQTIDCLNLGTAVYSSTYKKELDRRKHGVLPCDSEERTVSANPVDGNPPPGQRFVGIYIGWHGNTTGTLLNVREKTARKVATAEHSEVVETLYRLRDAAKEGMPERVRFILIGHSFGGLIVEQSMLKIYEEAYSRSDNTTFMSCGSGTTSYGIKPFADTIVTVAAAEHAVQAQKFIDLLRQHPQYCGSNSIAPALFRPIFVDFVAKRDFWSYGVGSEARHYLGGEHESSAAVKSEKDVYDQALPSLETVDWATPAVVTYFQSECFLKRPFATEAADYEGENVCDAERKSGLVESGARAFPHLPDTSPLSGLYVRFACRPKSLTPNATSYPECDTAEPWQQTADLHIFNRTPFWIAAIDVDIFGGHGPFGYPHFNQLLVDLGGSFDPISSDQMLPTPASFQGSLTNATPVSSN